jgi:uncharacterized protein YajQ (UPF0234 family)
MPSFDVVSKIDMHEVTNALDQTNRELTTRFDFKGTDARVESMKEGLTIIAPSDFQLKQVDEILRNKFAKRSIDIRVLEYKDPDVKLNEARQEVKIKQGIQPDFAKKVVKLIKDSNLKVQAAIQGEQIRVTGKKRDDLQEAIAMLRGAKLELPLQFENFRD